MCRYLALSLGSLGQLIAKKGQNGPDSTWLLTPEAEMHAALVQIREVLQIDKIYI